MALHPRLFCYPTTPIVYNDQTNKPIGDSFGFLDNETNDKPPCGGLPCWAVGRCFAVVPSVGIASQRDAPVLHRRRAGTPRWLVVVMLLLLLLVLVLLLFVVVCCCCWCLLLVLVLFVCCCWLILVVFCFFSVVALPLSLSLSVFAVNEVGQ